MSQGKYRNYGCHCGSGKKYKRCHLWLDQIKESREGLKTVVSPNKPIDNIRQRFDTDNTIV